MTFNRIIKTKSLKLFYFKQFSKIDIPTFSYLKKLEHPIHEYPYCVLNRELNFNENGLYLIAENKNKHINTNFDKRLYGIKRRSLFIITTLLAFSIPNIYFTVSTYAASFIFLVYNDYFHYNKLNRTMITKIYLNKCLKKVIFERGYSGLCESVYISNIRLIQPEEFEELNNNTCFYLAVTKLGGKKNFYNFPFTLNIYDREVFSAICNGIPVREKSDSQVLCLKTDDNINFYT